MNIYVDELPKGCGNCPCCLEFDWCRIDEGLEVSGYGSCSRGEIHPDCPLKLITDYTKQVRKEVCEEIKNKIEQAKLIYEWQGKEITIEDILDQIQGEIK